MSGSGKDIYKALIRLHVLHHAAAYPIYGRWLIEELREHGYNISPGTLYPMLHGLTRKGYLKMKPEDPVSGRGVTTEPPRRAVPHWQIPKTKYKNTSKNYLTEINDREVLPA